MAAETDMDAPVSWVSYHQSKRPMANFVPS
jgi:hypothetical protein